MKPEPNWTDIHAATKKVGGFAVLGQLYELRGDGYLEPIRHRAATDAIFVTIQRSHGIGGLYAR